MLCFEDGLRTGTTVEVITESHSVCTNPEAFVNWLSKEGSNKNNKDEARKGDKGSRVIGKVFFFYLQQKNYIYIKL